MIQIRDYKTDKFKTYIPKDKAKRLCTATDIMIGRYGPPIFQILRGLEGAYNVALMKAIPNNNIVSNDYLYYLLQDGELLYMLEGLSDRTCGQDGINMYELNRYIVGIPPVSEQNRIIEFLSNSISIVNTIISEKGDLLSIIQLTKSKILDLAIRGKLVPQNPNDEPANVLLDRIRAEKQELIKQGKIKPDKRDSVIFKGEDNSYYEKVGETITCIEDELPFDIPDGWMWCRGENCFRPMESRKPSGKTFKYIDIDSIDNKNQRIYESKVIETSKAPSRASRAVFSGSILFSLVRPYLKNIAIVDSCNAKSIASTGFYIATSNGVFNPDYLYLLMISDYVVDGLNQYMKGDNSPSISKENIERWLYPVPPLEEQKLIVEKCKSILQILQNIENMLN